MKIYDTHSDIFSNLYERKLLNESDIFSKYHEKSLSLGEIAGGIFVVYSEYDFDIINAYKTAIKEYAPYKDKYDIIFGLEGLRNVLTLDCLQELYDLGIRHAMLTWNEENHLATGIKGNQTRGVTQKGYEFLSFMESHNMIVDVSHLNEKSFFDVINYVKKPVIASHSCSKHFSDHLRNLSDEQLLALKKNGGYVGVNSARFFVSKDSSLQNVSTFVDHIMYIASFIGFDHVMLGLDMMDYLPGYESSGKVCPNLDDLTSHSDAQNIVKELQNRGLSNNVIEMICYKNFQKMKEELL